jgi:hypothetical protein
VVRRVRSWQAQPQDQLTKKQIRTLVASLRDISSVLATADSKLKAEVYAELGVTVKYDPLNRIITAESRPEGACRTERVGGPTGNFGPRPFVMVSPWSELRRAA